MKTIGIIGGGFSGMITAIHLLRKNNSIEVILFDPKSKGQGIAYSPQSDAVLLNVMTSKMSAFANEPLHFLNWCKEKDPYRNISDELLGQSFMPRSLYGNYLQDLYELNLENNSRFKHVKENVLEIKLNGRIQLLKTNSKQISVDKTVLATGNALPSNHVVPKGLINDNRYHQNPWNIDFSKISKSKPLVIIGNGLSMVDTIMELRKRKFDQHIYAVSPNGFNILPHRQFNFNYDGPLKNNPEQYSLRELLHLFKTELRKLKAFGISAEPLVDTLRPYTQSIWKKMTPEEKQIFMKKLRHLWGQARHRLPFVSYDFILKEQISENLSILAGKLIEFRSDQNELSVTIHQRKNKKAYTINCSAVINCTGPETNYRKIEGNLIGNLISEGILCQDSLFLGIEADDQFRTLDSDSNTHNIYALGPLLKGKLWESTAVNELRTQAERLAEIISIDLEVA